MTEKERCAARVWMDTSFPRQRACGIPARYVEEGRYWCGTHLPSRVKEKEEKRRAERSAEWKAQEARRAHETALAKARETVIEAAKAWRAWRNPEDTRLELDVAVDFLNVLEAKGPTNG